MRYKLKRPIESYHQVITPLVVGISYHGSVEALQRPDGPMTVEQVYRMWPHFFEVIDTLSIKTQIMINLTSQYTELQKHYGFDEIAMAEKISEIAEKILSKI